MKNKEVVLMFLLLLSFVVSGCSTNGEFKQILLNNWGMSPMDAEEKLKRKPVEKTELQNNIKMQRYKYWEPFVGINDYILYFKDERLVRYAPYTKANHYESMYELGVISYEKYQSVLDNLIKQREYEIQQREYERQRNYAAQQMRNQNESLRIQRESLELEKKRQRDESFKIRSVSTNCSPDGLGGFRCSSREGYY